MVELSSELALKVFAALVVGWLIYRLVSALNVTPPEDKDNVFLKKEKKVPPKQLEKPASGVKYLYRLARGTEPSRSGKKGEKINGKATVGQEAQYMVDLPWPARPGGDVAGYYGVKGLDDDCLHLSTAAQVVETAKLYFKGVEDVILLKYDTSMIEKDEDLVLRWEQALPPPGTPARPDAFPHVYAKEKGVKARLSWWKLATFVPLPLGADGTPKFPEKALSEEEVIAAPSRKPPAGEAAAAKPAEEEEEERDEAAEQLAALEEQLRKEAGLS